MQSMYEKSFLSPLQMLEIARYHAQAARHLLAVDGKTFPDMENNIQPALSLLYLAIELTFKACILQEHGRLRPVKGLQALYELTPLIELSQPEQALLKKLGQQQVFRKGAEYKLWENEQQLQVFAHQIVMLHERILEQIPLELNQDYWS